ncbi:hypothetical protein [Aurantiacibacter gilvus]|uniref:Uncharacterized protein n=1 Tax=Aurantiacibacter gilvus TaxID=3139141 RepID=A0ABU9IBK0_9SPHN
MSFGKSLVVALILAAPLGWFMHGAMMSTGNNGEFVDPATGNFTGYYYQVLGVWMALIVLPVTAVLALIGVVRRRRD